MRRAALWGGVVLAQVLGTSAWAVEPGWIADPKSGCRVWDSFPQPKESISWSGPCENGVANGHGTLQWYLSGTFAERDDGEWVNGKMNGHGVITSSDGIRYDGDFSDGQMNGHGVFAWPDGTRYEGEFHDGKFDGHGVKMWADGARYDGEWLAGFPNGYGIATSSAGRRYEGIWTNGCFQQGNKKAWIDKTKKECGFQLSGVDPQTRPSGPKLGH